MKTRRSLKSLSSMPLLVKRYSLRSFSQLIPIPQEATDIHGITNEMVSKAKPFWVLWYHDIEPILSGRNIIVYNHFFDMRMVFQSLKARDSSVQTSDIKRFNFICAMRWYAEFWGEIDDYREQFKWQSLTNACAQQDIDVSDLTAHRAEADCEMTRRLVHSVNTKIVTA